MRYGKWRRILLLRPLRLLLRQTVRHTGPNVLHPAHAQPTPTGPLYRHPPVVLSINMGCGAGSNRVALGQFAAYVQQQWSAMHEEDTTCAYCGKQFLPSLIEEHEKKCEGKIYQGDMLDYLKDNTALYTRVKNGDYTLRMEPTSNATGETRMGLVCVKDVHCNSCGQSFPANELEQHRRWSCEWTVVDNSNSEGTGIIRSPGLLAPSQDFETFKKEFKFTSML